MCVRLDRRDKSLTHFFNALFTNKDWSDSNDTSSEIKESGGGGNIQCRTCFGRRPVDSLVGQNRDIFRDYQDRGSGLRKSHKDMI